MCVCALFSKRCMQLICTRANRRYDQLTAFSLLRIQRFIIKLLLLCISCRWLAMEFGFGLGCTCVPVNIMHKIIWFHCSANTICGNTIDLNQAPAWAVVWRSRCVRAASGEHKSVQQCADAILWNYIYGRCHRSHTHLLIVSVVVGVVLLAAAAQTYTHIIL